MESSTTVKKMMTHEINVPDYQRAYSWESQRHVKTFMDDLNNHVVSGVTTPYYFGHFLFEQDSLGEDKYYIIDGQQRATTILICLSALFHCLKEKNDWSDEDETLYEDMIIRKEKIKFSTVAYDSQDFIDYIIKKSKPLSDNLKLETNSAKRFTKAWFFFYKEFSKKTPPELRAILWCITSATCTTHIVNGVSEAIQMFIFQNDRGKKPTQLEILKSKFMFQIHLRAGATSSTRINEIIQRFEKIYKCISYIDHKMDEDEILIQAYRFYKNSLHAEFSMDEVDKELNGPTALDFIEDFSLILETTFDAMRKFRQDESAIFSVHSLLVLGRLGLAYPFIIKAYAYSISDQEKALLFSSLEHIIFRHRMVGTRADLASRLNDKFKNWEPTHNNIKNIVKHINWLKETDDGWWNHWNNDALKNDIQGWIDHGMARYILWKYENHLLAKATQSGYKPLQYSQIEKPALEHIAPQTPKEPLAAGYGTYDEEFKQQYLNCLGNYLLVSTSHNSSIGNKPFTEKSNSYTHLKQQLEIKDLHGKGLKTWGKKSITERHNKLVDFVLTHL